MVKSGLIIGAVSFFLVLGSTFILSPLCAPCVAIFLGLAAGYLAGVFDKPALSGDSAKKGAIAALIASAFALLGGMLGGVGNAFVLGNMGYGEQFNQALGFVPVGPNGYWIGQLTVACCAGLFNLALMAGLGAAGGAIWFSLVGKKQAEIYPPYQPQ